MRSIRAIAARGADQQGATSVEYALMASLIALAIFLSVSGVGAALVTMFSNANLLNAL